MAKQRTMDGAATWRLLCCCIVALLALACSGPEYRGVDVDYEFVADGEREAMRTLQALIEDHSGLRFGDLWDTATVYWVDSDCRNGDPGIQFGDVCYSGLTWGCGEIYVQIYGSLCHSSLLHEFAHCLKHETGINPWDGDSDHSDKDFWAIVDEATADLCDRVAE